MAAPIGPGDWVECVSRPLDAAGLLRLGAIYCVEVVGPALGPCTGRAAACSETSVRLVGVHHAHPGTRPDEFCACAFRPIYRPKSDLIESLKVPPKRAPRKLVVAS